MEKPHLELYWTFDVPNYKLYIQLSEDCEYEAHEGGTKGYTKTYKGVKSHVTPQQWQEIEKFWISEHYGEKYGYFQPDHNRETRHPKYGYVQNCVNGISRQGEYLDHMQRPQRVLEAEDLSYIFTSKDGTVFETPDNGKTIFKRLPTRDVLYPQKDTDPTAVWPEWPQACAMQPRTKGPRLSSYEELAQAGCPAEYVDKCKSKTWASPKFPELQKYYIYPTL